MYKCAPAQAKLTLAVATGRAWFFALALGCIFSLGACTTPPGISVLAVDVVEVGSTANQVAIRLQLTNPTKVAIRIDTWNYSVRVREDQVYSGQWVAAITIPPESRLLTAIPAVVPIQNQPGPESPWSIDGSLRYLETSRFSQLLYDLGLNRPSAPFTASGPGMGSGGTIPSAG